MTRVTTLGLAAALAASAAACDSETGEGGPVTIAIQQAMTGETTTAGTFRMSGALADNGATAEQLVFGGPLTVQPVPVTFRRTLTGESGTLVLRGGASLRFTSQTAATITGTWEVESGTGRYAGMSGGGEFEGTADFGAAPPTAQITYVGEIERQ
jgi:hypothetical protein